MSAEKMDMQNLCPHTKEKGTHKPGENALLWRESAAPCTMDLVGQRCAVFLVDQKGSLNERKLV